MVIQSIKDKQFNNLLQVDALQALDLWLHKHVRTSGLIYAPVTYTTKHGTLVHSHRWMRSDEMELDKRTLQRMRRAWDLRSSSEELTGGQRSFIQQALGGLVDLSDDELRMFFKNQYSKLATKEKERVDEISQQRVRSTEDNIDEFFAKIRVGQTTLPLLYESMAKAALGFKTLNPTSSELLRWIDGVEQAYDEQDPDKLLNIFNSGSQYFFQFNDINDKNERLAKILDGDIWDSTLIRRVKKFAAGKSQENIKRFLLALKPIESDIDLVDKQRIHAALTHNNYEKALGLLGVLQTTQLDRRSRQARIAVKPSYAAEEAPKKKAIQYKATLSPLITDNFAQSVDRVFNNHIKAFDFLSLYAPQAKDYKSVITHATIKENGGKDFHIGVDLVTTQLVSGAWQSVRVGEINHTFHLSVLGKLTVSLSPVRVSKVFGSSTFAMLQHMENELLRHGVDSILVDVAPYASIGFALQGYDFVGREVENVQNKFFKAIAAQYPSAFDRTRMKLRAEVRQMHHPWEFIRWDSLGEQSGQNLMSQIKWKGHKILNIHNPGFEIGQKYYAIMQKKRV